MYSLYAKRLCPYARAAIGALHDAGQDFEVRYVDTPEQKDALKRQGGDTHVPFLVDEAAHVRIGDSGTIIAYLQEKHGNTVGT